MGIVRVSYLIITESASGDPEGDHVSIMESLLSAVAFKPAILAGGVTSGTKTESRALVANAHQFPLLSLTNAANRYSVFSDIPVSVSVTAPIPLYSPATVPSRWDAGNAPSVRYSTIVDSASDDAEPVHCTRTLSWPITVDINAVTLAGGVLSGVKTESRDPVVVALQLPVVSFTNRLKRYHFFCTAPINVSLNLSLDSLAHSIPLPVVIGIVRVSYLIITESASGDPEGDHVSIMESLLSAVAFRPATLAGGVTSGT
jgi:hypothetical protein